MRQASEQQQQQQQKKKKKKNLFIIIGHSQDELLHSLCLLEVCEFVEFDDY
jgi:hypothetical protein